MSQTPDVPPSTLGPALPETDAQRAERLEGLLRQHDDLMALVGHEMRNPLHALSLQLALARGSAQSAGQDETLARVAKSQRMLARYVDRVTVLFELIRARGEGIATRPVETDLAALVRAIGDGLMPEAQYRGVDLRVEAPETCPARLDPQFVEQMVDNLLINAFKHAAARHVTLSLHAADGATASHARIEVSDDGRGIAEIDRERIFGKFGVGQNSHRGTGSGLGLWIVTRLATALGGAVTLHDRPQGGSVFTLTLPVSARSSTPP